MVKKIQIAFATCVNNTCILDESSDWFCIKDDEKTKRCYICKDKDKYPRLFIENTYKRKLNFLAIDACIFTDNAHQRCDCAVFDTSYFHFAELKHGASNLTRDEKKKEAIGQLKKTIEVFMGKIDFSSHKIKAHIAVGHFTSVPSAESSDLIEKLYFKKNLKTDLLEGNHIRF